MNDWMELREACLAEAFGLDVGSDDDEQRCRCLSFSTIVIGLVQGVTLAAGRLPASLLGLQPGASAWLIGLLVTAMIAAICPIYSS
jgi:hypothetical protein